ncbi:hypothetical protein HK102_006404 [Quaeritorhiza haematococci]|nr:hypothetical protein HK102_006404 [Quaeritorhiza haematococci]
MPPKKAGGSSKTEQKAKQKIVEDKTFGLKNKNKSAKVNKYVQQVQQQVMAAGNRKQLKETDAKKNDAFARKKAEEAKKAELAELFKPVQTQKVPFGVDPKTIICAFYKSGQCQKGSKCKFSHDLGTERKSAKIDLYTDARDAEEDEKEKDTMDKWDQSKLESVVAKKHGNVNKPTEIVCKFFLEAIDSRKYGWFWQCPNGDTCKYRHALPPGYVLKKKETDEEKRLREESEGQQISIEEFLETERHNLGTNLTPVTYESFEKWKKERKAKQATEQEAAAKKKAEAYKQFRSGMKTGLAFSGRELFDFNPEWANDGDDEEGAMDVYVRDENDSEGESADSKANGTSAQKEDSSSTPSSSAKGKEKAAVVEADEEGGDAVEVAEDLFEAEDLEGLDDDDDDDE